MNWQIIAPTVIAASIFVLILLERLVPYDRGQKLIRDGFWTDLIFYTIIQNYVLAVVIAGLIGWFDASTGASRWHLLGNWPIAGQVTFFVVTHDFYIYVFHRWQHNNRFLWRLHEAHHSATQVDWLAGARSHVFEILINQTVEFAPMLLLGADPQVPLIKGMISAVWGMYIHSNIDVRTGTLQFVINGPEAHRWHHAIDLEPPGMNFGTKLAIWDLLFGTFFLPRHHKPAAYGLTYVDFPKSYFRQNLFAFRPWRNDGSTAGAATHPSAPAPSLTSTRLG